MLFYLSDSLIVNGDNPEYTNIIMSVRNIANQAINKIHYVIGSIKAIAYFREIFKSEYFLGSFFNRLFQNYSMLSIPPFINYYIEVTRQDNYTVNDNNRTINKMSYDNFINSDNLQKTMVLGESYNDSNFYEHILNYYRGKVAPHANFSLHALPGNGKQTREIIKNEKRSKYILICIVDSDKRFPTDEPKQNSTCTICSQIPETSIYHLIVLDVQEVENLIPTNYIDSLDWKNFNNEDRRNKRHFDYLKTDTNADRILSYFDYKNGIRKTHELMSSQEFKIFAEMCFNANKELKSNNKDFTTFINKKKEKDELIPRLFSGTTLITNVLSMIKEGKQPTPKLLPFQERNWNLIGHALLNWCIAESKDSMI